MTVPALYTRHLGLAINIAKGFHLPGSEIQDVHQEARIGLWIACRNYDIQRGAFPAFAQVVIRRRLTKLLQAALSERHQILTLADRDGWVDLEHEPDLERVVVARETLREIVERQDEIALEKVLHNRRRWRESKRRLRAAAA